jgi:hypothetical protein
MSPRLMCMNFRSIEDTKKHTMKSRETILLSYSGGVSCRLGKCAAAAAAPIL